MAAVLEVQMDADQYHAEAARVQSTSANLFEGAKREAKSFADILTGGGGLVQGLLNVAAVSATASVWFNRQKAVTSALTAEQRDNAIATRNQHTAYAALTSIFFAQGGIIGGLLSIASLNRDARDALRATANAQGHLNARMRLGGSTFEHFNNALKVASERILVIGVGALNAANTVPVLSTAVSALGSLLGRNAAISRASAQAQAQLSRSFAAAGAEAGAAGRQVNALSSRFTALAPSIARVLTLGLLLKAALIAVPFLLIAQAAAKFEKSMVRLRTQVGLTAEATREMGRAARGFAEEFAISASQVSNAGLAVTSGGLRGAEAIAAMGDAAKLAALGFGEATRTGRLLSAALIAFEGRGLTSAKVADILARAIQVGNFNAQELTSTIGRSLPIAANLGVELAELAGLIASYTQSGVSAAIANTAIYQTMIQLLRPSQEAKKIIDEAGGSYEGLIEIIETKGLLPALLHLREGLGLTDEQLARVIGSGEALSFALDATSSGSGQRYRKNIDDIAGSAGTADEALDALRKTVGFKWRQAQVRLNEVLLQFGEIVLPIVNAALSAMSWSLGAIVDSVNWLKENWKYAIPGSAVFHGVKAGAKALWDWAFGADAAAAAGTDLTHDMDSLREEMSASAPPTKEQIKNLRDAAEAAFYAAARKRSFNKQIEDGIHPLQASANALAGTTTAVDALKKSADDAELVIKDFNWALRQMETDRARREMLALAAVTEAAAASAAGLDPFIAGQEALDRFARLHELIEQRLGLVEAAKRLIEGGAAGAGGDIGGSQPRGKTQAEILIDQWREAERVAKQYFDNVRDQLDDQQRALTRASEDVVDLINRQFTERFLQLAETANITADERRRIEVRLRAQRDLTLAEARRENREEQRRIEDRLEVEEDRRRTQAQEASNAIARLRGAGAPTGRRGDPIHVVQDDSGATQASTATTTGTDGSAGTTTTTGAQTGADGAGSGADASTTASEQQGFGATVPTPANQCNGDPNFARFNSLSAQMRAAGLTPPRARCDQLPLQIGEMAAAITSRQRERAAQEARLAAVQGGQGIPEPGASGFGGTGGSGRTRTQPGDPEPGAAGFGGVDSPRTRTQPGDPEPGNVNFGGASDRTVKENTQAIKDLADAINTGGFEGFGGGPTAGTRRSSTGHGQQYYVDPARGRL